MTPGQQISRYRIERPLGRGGMGVVYLAEDTRLSRPVALKFLAADTLSEQDKARFLNEARAAAAVRHPNICPIHDIEEADGRLFIAMAYLEGETLASRVRRGPIPAEQAAGIALQAARGLAQAHAQGIVHRDIKAGNILLSPNGHASILDFGLALQAGAARLTADGATMGTPVYMSPEQCEGKPVDHRTDIWSLGVVLFEMIAGVPPFRREHSAATAHAILQDPTPPLAELRPGTPAALEQAIRKALEKDPSRRWASARDFAAALAPFATHAEDTASADDCTTQVLPASAASSAAEPSRKRMRAAAAALVLIALLAAGAYWRFGSSGRAGRSAEAPGARLIAVLPFEVLGAQAGSLEIANGLTEILTAALSDFERADASIAAIPSSEIRRRNINSAAEARRVYGASQVVGGTAQPVGGKIQFSIALVDPETSRQMAARVFDYDPADPIGGRNRAVVELAGLLSVNAESAQRSAVGGETATPAASSAYLKGRGFLARYDVAGNLDRALELLQEAVRADPDYALAHAALAEAQWRKSRVSGDGRLAAQAVEHGERAVRLNPSLPTMRTTLAAIYTTGGRSADAVRELNEALKIAPGSAETHRELARVHAAEGRFEEAEAAYRRAIAARPTDWYGYLLLGLLHQEKLEYGKAIDAFSRARELTPDNEVVYRNLGVAYMGKGEYRRAADELQRSLRLKPNASTYATLGATYFLEHRYAEALAAVETAIDLDPNRYYFWGNLGIYCRWNPGSEGRSRPALEKAVELARKFLEVSPKDYDVRSDLGEYYARLGDKAAALAQIEKIPGAARPSRISRIAVVYELTGNRAKAIPLLAAALKNQAAWHSIQDDPDLAGLWADPRLQQLLGRPR